MCDPKMKTSRQGKIALAASEAIVDTMYYDSVGVPTVGIGHTKAAGNPDPMALRGRKLTIERILEIFEQDLPDYEAIIHRNVKVELSQQQFDALVHFVYNIGEGNFKKSNLLRNLNAGNYKAAGLTGFHGWLRPKSLKNRRDKERNIFLYGKYGESKAAYYTANFAGKLIRLGMIDVSQHFPEN